MSARVHPIVERFGSLGIAPLSLCTLPTRVHALPSIGAHAWIKRDDETHPEVAGNKLRKLEWVGATLKRTGAKRAVLLGATGTNAGVAAAMVCRSLGVQLDVLTFPQPASATVERNRALMHHYGARLHARGPLLSAALAWQLSPRRLVPRTTFLHAGCSNPEATFAYVDAALELKAQMDAGVCPLFEEIVVAAGSGATLAGLTLGCALAGLRTRVTGVRVAPLKVGPFSACAPSTIARMMDACRAALAKASASPIAPAPAPTLIDDFYGGGYGVGTDAGREAIEVFAREGVTLEQTYTGKAAAAFLVRARASTSPVLFWNTFSARPDPPGFLGTRRKLSG
jgi:1-aminocyclopropane-1-carboxylate deaminase/D-cysteine desulfhydrase-like pyridoxal-dependent ACC family enzyme